MTQKVAAFLPGYYGWVVVALVGISNLSVFSINPTFGLFIGPLESAFGWSRAEVSRSLMVAAVFGAISAPLIGWLADKWGTRLLIIFTGTLASICFVLLPQIHIIWMFNLLFGLAFACSTNMVGQLLGSLLINHWFSRRKGRAMGIVMMGASGGALLFVPLHTFVIGTFGWQTGYVLQGLFVVLVVVLPALFLMVDYPHQIKADTKTEFQSLGNQSTDEKNWELGELMALPVFWCIMVAIMLGSAAVYGYFSHAIPMMESHGISRANAAFAWSIFFVVGIISKLIWGFWIERIGVQKALVLLFIGEAAGLWVLQQSYTPSMMLGYAVFNGVAHGPFLQLLSSVWADYFGTASLGKIMGTVQPIIIIFGSLGPWLGGILYDLDGNYDRFINLSIVSALVAAVLFACCKKPVAIVLAPKT